ncbi:MAG: hypothetical protein WCX88_02635 [Patescibacteria group bacterium]
MKYKILIAIAVLATATFFWVTGKNIANAKFTSFVADKFALSTDEIDTSEPTGVPNGFMGGFELTEEQRINMERLEKMPYGKMNANLWIKITAAMSCLIDTKQVTGNKIEDAKMNEIVKPYGVTGEEYLAFYLQALAGKIDLSEFDAMGEDGYFEKMNKEFEELKKNNCKVAGVDDIEVGLEPEPKEKLNEDVWFEITARIRCLDRIMMIFTKYEIGTIFEPFGVTQAEYNVYGEGMIKKMEDLANKDTKLWTKDDEDFALKYKQFKLRIEDLKKKNCVLEDGRVISEEYNNFTEPTGWETAKCKVLSCNNCYGVTESSNFWEKYRCNNLCTGCPVGTPPVKPVTNCAGFCSLASCPDSAESLAGTCAPEKVCTKCGFLKLFKCCKEKEAVCCQTKPAEVCKGTCGLKECSKGMANEGTKDCPSGKEKYKCGFLKLFNCKREVSGVCCK